MFPNVPGATSNQRRVSMTARFREAVCQSLEPRTLLSFTWTGGADSSWANGSNWLTHLAPSEGSNLIFPANATRLTGTNDLLTSVNSITLNAGYSISGQPIRIAHGITNGTSASSVLTDLVLTGNQTFLSQGGRLAFGGAISDGGNGYGLTIDGGVSGGSIYFGTPATYTGTTTVLGELELNTTIASPVTLAQYGMLIGRGSVGGLLAVSGSQVSVGTLNTPGTIAAGDLNLESGSQTYLDLSGTTPGTGYDRFTTNGTVNLGGMISVTRSAGFTPSVGQQFDIIDNDGTDPVVGTFAGLAEGAVINASGQYFRISYAGGTGNDVVLTTLATSTASVTSSVNPTTFGQSTTFDVHVTGSNGTPTGSVMLSEGGVSLGTQSLNGSGHASFILASVSAGSNEVDVNYLGDTTYLGSFTSVQQVVNKANVTMTVGRSSATTVFGAPVTFSATVNANAPSAAIPDGDVEFFDGAYSLGLVSLDDSGVATLEINDLGVGSHTVTAVYNGNARFNGADSINTASDTVTRDTSTTSVSVLSPTASFSDIAEFQSTVVAAGGGSVTGDVEFFEGTNSLGVVAVDGSGVAILDIATLDIGQHVVSAVYAGDANVAGSSTVSSATVAITNNPPTSTGLSDVDVNENSAATIVGLRLAFADIEDQDSDLVYTIAGNTDAAIITPTITDQTLTLSYAADTFGAGNITVRATDTYGAHVDTTFTVNVSHVAVSGALQFASDAESGAEGQILDLVVSRIGGSQGSASANFAVTGGSATADDYTLAAGLITFGEGEISKSIPITLNTDTLDEDDQTVVVSLSNPSGGASLGTRTSTTVTITDNRAPIASDFTEVYRPGMSAAPSPLSNASDPDGDALTVSVLTPPAHGSAVIDTGNPDNPTQEFFRYRPDSTWYGDDSMVYQVDDGHGHTASATIHLHTEGAGVVASAVTPGLSDLVVIGTAGDDTIQFYPYKNTKDIKVMIGGTSMSHYTVSGRILAFGLGGNDLIAAKYIKQNVIFSGGDGNDRLIGSAGKDILVGGDGDDRLQGYEKRDLMIGGEGADRIDGGAPDDIVIGGSTSFDALELRDQIGLTDVVNAWNGAGKRTARENLIMAGVGSTLAKLDSTTVFADNVVDDLGKQTTKNWIFGDSTAGVTADVVRGRRAA